MWIKWIIFLIGVLFCRYCANMDTLVRYWKELSRTILTAGIGSKACRRRNWVLSRSFSTLNRAESSYPVKSNRLLIKNGPNVATHTISTTDWEVTTHHFHSLLITWKCAQWTTEQRYWSLIHRLQQTWSRWIIDRLNNWFSPIQNTFI